MNRGPEVPDEDYDPNDEILAEILRNFVEVTFQEILGVISAAIDAGDAAQVAKNAHILMGSVAVYRSRMLGTVAKRLEGEAKAAARREAMRADFEELVRIRASLI